MADAARLQSQPCSAPQENKPHTPAWLQSHGPDAAPASTAKLQLAALPREGPEQSSSDFLMYFRSLRPEDPALHVGSLPVDSPLPPLRAHAPLPSRAFPLHPVSNPGSPFAVLAPPSAAAFRRRSAQRRRGAPRLPAHPRDHQLLCLALS